MKTATKQHTHDRLNINKGQEMKILVVKSDNELIPGFSVIQKDNEYSVYYKDNGRPAEINISDNSINNDDFAIEDHIESEIRCGLSDDLIEIADDINSGKYDKSRESVIELKGRLRRIVDNVNQLYRSKK